MLFRSNTGKCYYTELSEGQKVMFFLSVRLAIADILRRNTSSVADFLILDEITGPLSEKNRDELAFLIRSLLHKMYKQVFLVSHASMRSVFAGNIRVTMSDEISEAVVF